MLELSVSARAFRLASLLLAALLAPEQAVAQKHPITDTSLGASLLAASVPFPSSPQRIWRDSLHVSERFRMEVGYSRLLLADGAQPLLIAGVRTDFARQDSSGLSAAVTGVRLGFRTADDAGDRRLPFAIEVHAGIRSLGYLARPSWPDIGVDLAVGWSNLAENTQGSLGLRVPVEFVRAISRGRLTYAVVPTMAWGHIRLRQCENLGPNDNCGDLGLQLEFGRTRFLVAGGVSAGLDRSGLALSVGTQQLLAGGQDPRVAIGLSWTP